MRNITRNLELHQRRQQAVETHEFTLLPELQEMVVALSAGIGLKNTTPADEYSEVVKQIVYLREIIWHDFQVGKYPVNQHGMPLTDEEVASILEAQAIVIKGYTLE